MKGIEMKHRLLYLLFCVACGLSVSACYDDNPFSEYGEIPKGSTTVQLTAEFRPLQPALTRADGQAIQTIENLFVLLYDTEGNLVSSGTDNGAYPITSFTGTNAHAEADACRKFNLTIPYGAYKMYAVANIADLNTNSTYTDALQTETGLKTISRSWDNSSIANNKEMFGYFTTTDDASNGKEGFDAPTIVVNQKDMSFHAWIKRLASKVTVQFDGTELNENVYIYIKSVQIKDIPNSCYLGKDNRPQSKNELITDGETLTHGTGDDYTQWLTVTKGGAGINNQAGVFGSDHSSTAEALYFYENMQGVSSDDPNNKTQVSDGNGGVLGKEDEKDLKPYGTYVEVKGFYENKNQGTLSRGDITYRFMLGKNITDDFNAERNYHYKLTLKFKNDANDVDWHIEYDIEPDIYVPNPYYISYLYNQEMGNGGLPVRVVAPEGRKVTKLNLKIIENNWGPDGAGSELNYWTGDVYSYGANDEKVYAPDCVWTGFLSLSNKEYEAGTLVTGSLTQLELRDGGGTYSPYQDWVDNEMGEKNYSITQAKEVSINIPLYTRAKQLVTASGFVGNNPYVAYERTAKVKITATLDNNTTMTETVKIIQVKRLVNPTGIWRKANSQKVFEVVLMEQTQEGGDFTPLISHGPWTASIIQGKNWVLIDGGTTDIKGSTETQVKFTYKPNGTITDTADPRCGIIEVKYHNNTCSHLIFVRQGYQPMRMGNSSSAKWLSFNMRTTSTIAASPLEEGSLFKWNNWTRGIYDLNNYDNEDNRANNLGFNQKPTGAVFDVIGTSTDYTWDNISTGTKSNAFSNPTATVNGNSIKVAQQSDYKLFQTSTYGHGYGILYDDNSTTTSASLALAQGYYRQASSKEGRGMRGCFVYNKSNGRNLFFPIGFAGHGHRNAYFYDSGNKTGALRYGSFYDYISETGTISGSSGDYVQWRPLFYDLFTSPGAIYWTRDAGGEGWDINYRTLDFNNYNVAWRNGTLSDACFIRCVINE